MDTCPGCNRALKWDRKRPAFCGCGQNLSEVDSRLEQSNAWVLAKILAHRVSKDPQYFLGLSVPSATLEKLANLSLDGICKIVWFLGHCIAEMGRSSLGHGRKKPNIHDVEKMLEMTMYFLDQWPDSIGLWLKQKLVDEFDINFTVADRRKILGPTDHYIRSCLLEEELQFLVKAYEQHLMVIWRALGSRNPILIFEKQLLLEF